MKQINLTIVTIIICVLSAFMFHYMDATMTEAWNQNITIGIIYGAIGKITSILLAIFVLFQAKNKVSLRGVLVGLPYAFMAVSTLSVGSALVALAIAGNTMTWLLTTGALGVVLLSYVGKNWGSDLCYATKELFIIK